ncbi:helix-turn-helix transcriptional regulator [Streptomyces sp. NPDC096033]|uniref:helix-turn-helix transcriptional regulator n=1 Tax=Streptomyces sp. NPDC096033 TaxID=3366071 RepID=UPI003830C0F4
MSTLSEHESPLVGRSNELSTLDRALRRVRDGIGGCVVIEGYAGLGKSRLLAESERRAARHGVAVARGQATELDHVVPMASLLGALSTGPAPVLDRATLASLAGGGFTESGRFWLVHRIAEAIEQAARRRPLAVVLDDMHWADELTAQALRILLPTLHASEVLWLLALRPAPEPSPVHDLTDRLVADGAERLRLAPLSGAEVAELCARTLGSTPSARLLAHAERSDGNPFLLVELLSRPESEPPSSLSRGWLTGLSEPARRVLEVGSVLARPFSVAEAGGLLGLSGAELNSAVSEAVAVGMLIAAGSEGSELRFRHDLIRETVYGSLPGPVRHALHQEAAGVLRATGRPAAEISQHLARGGQRGNREAIATLHLAVREAAAQSSGIAADLMLQLLDLVEEDSPERPRLLTEAVRLLANAGRLGQARELGERALRSGLDPREETAMLLALAEALKHAGHDRVVLDYVGRALAAPTALGAVRAELYAVQSHALLSFPGIEAAEQSALAAQQAGRASGADSAVVFATVARSATARGRGDIAGSLALAGEAVQLAETGSAEVRRRHPRLWLARALASADRFGEADAVNELGRREAERIGSAWSHPLWSLNRAALKLASGFLEDAQAEAEAGARVADQLSARAVAPHLLALLARIALLRDERKAAAELIRESRHHAMGSLGAIPPFVDWISALQLEADGRPQEAREAASGVLSSLSAGASGGSASAPASGSAGASSLSSPAAALSSSAAAPAEGSLLFLSEEPCASVQLVRITLAAGDTEGARTAVRAARRLAEANPGVRSLAAFAAQAAGLLDGDPAALAWAAEAMREAPRRLAAASALEDAGAAAGAPGAGLLEEALAAYTGMGARREIARVRRRLERLGPGAAAGAVAAAPGQAAPREPEAELTPSELRVVRLVVEGLTNRAVADRLFLSPHTVDTHLRHAFAKYGVNSRVELARAFLAGGRAG